MPVRGGGYGEDYEAPNPYERYEDASALYGSQQTPWDYNSVSGGLSDRNPYNLNAIWGGTQYQQGRVSDFSHIPGAELQANQIAGQARDELWNIYNSLVDQGIRPSLTPDQVALDFYQQNVGGDRLGYGPAVNTALLSESIKRQFLNQPEVASARGGEYQITQDQYQRALEFGDQRQQGLPTWQTFETQGQDRDWLGPLTLGAIGALAFPPLAATAIGPVGAGAVIGGTTAAAREGDIQRGILTGALAGAVTPLSEALGTTLGSDIAGRIASSSILGGLKDQVSGGNFVEGAIKGGATASVAAGISETGMSEALKDILTQIGMPRNFAESIAKAIERTSATAISTSLLGGNVDQAIANSALSSAFTIGQAGMTDIKEAAIAASQELEDAGMLDPGVTNKVSQIPESYWTATAQTSAPTLDAAQLRWEPTLQSKYGEQSQLVETLNSSAQDPNSGVVRDSSGNFIVYGKYVISSDGTEQANLGTQLPITAGAALGEGVEPQFSSGRPIVGDGYGQFNALDFTGFNLIARDSDTATNAFRNPAGFTLIAYANGAQQLLDPQQNIVPIQQLPSTVRQELTTKAVEGRVNPPTQQLPTFEQAQIRQQLLEEPTQTPRSRISGAVAGGGAGDLSSLGGEPSGGRAAAAAAPEFYTTPAEMLSPRARAMQSRYQPPQIASSYSPQALYTTPDRATAGGAAPSISRALSTEVGGIYRTGGTAGGAAGVGTEIYAGLGGDGARFGTSTGEGREGEGAGGVGYGGEGAGAGYGAGFGTGTGAGIGPGEGAGYGFGGGEVSPDFRMPSGGRAGESAGGAFAPSYYTTPGQDMETITIGGGGGELPDVGSAYLARGIVSAPEITGSPVQGTEKGKRRKVWNIESLREALGV